MKTKTTRGQYMAKVQDVFVRVAGSGPLSREEARQMFLEDAVVSERPYEDKKKGPKWRTRFAPSTKAYRFCMDIIGIGNEGEATFCEEPVSKPKSVQAWHDHYAAKITLHATKATAPDHVTYNDGLLEAIRAVGREYLDRTGTCPFGIPRKELTR